MAFTGWENEKLSKRIAAFELHYAKLGVGANHSKGQGHYSTFGAVKVSLSANSVRQPGSYARLGSKFFRMALTRFGMRVISFRVWSDNFRNKDGSSYKRLSAHVK